MVEDTLYCEVHPEVETMLRCNKCNRLMCTNCAVRTPVGYRCKECVRGQQDGFYTAVNTDYVVAGAVSFLLSLVGGFISVPSFFLAFLMAPTLGTIIVQAVRWATERRRGRYTVYVVIGGIMLGGGAVPLFFLRGGAIGALIFAGIASGVAYSWLYYGKRYG